MRKKIFICDDYHLIVETLKMLLLHRTDAIVLTETDSRLALERLVEERPDMLIVDISMPWVSGVRLIKEIRANALLRGMFIICISANSNGKELAISAGADVFLPKPLDFEQILHLINGTAGGTYSPGQE